MRKQTGKGIISEFAKKIGIVPQPCSIVDKIQIEDLKSALYSIMEEAYTECDKTFDNFKSIMKGKMMDVKNTIIKFIKDDNVKSLFNNLSNVELLRDFKENDIGIIKEFTNDGFTIKTITFTENFTKCLEIWFTKSINQQNGGVSFLPFLNKPDLCASFKKDGIVTSELQEIVDYFKKKTRTAGQTTKGFIEENIRKDFRGIEDQNLKEQYVKRFLNANIISDLQYDFVNNMVYFKVNEDFAKCLESLLTSKGGSPSKVTIKGKQCTVYVKVNGEFMTVKQAQKLLLKAKPKTPSPSKKTPSKR